MDRRTFSGSATGGLVALSPVAAAIGQELTLCKCFGSCIGVIAGSARPHSVSRSR